MPKKPSSKTSERDRLHPSDVIIRKASTTLHWLQDADNALAYYNALRVEMEYAMRKMKSVRALHPSLKDQFDSIDKKEVQPNE